MGVSGFTPFLQKVCPTVLKRFPNRLEALRGKKIIIDGTLITQRFHYIENESPRQHVLSWYRLARELNRHDISALCVFDGKERSAAKADETQRRRKVRQLTVTRGSIEEDRFQRLHSLKDTIHRLQSLDVPSRQKFLDSLKKTPFRRDDGSATMLQEQDSIAGARVEKQPPSEAAPTLSPTDIPSVESLDISGATSSVTPDDLATQLSVLHINYKATIVKLATISADSDMRPSALTTSLPSDEERAENAMTKTQYQLMCEEGKLWETLASSLELRTSDVSATSEKGVGDLLDRSFTMATSFRRRNNFPTSQTYTESKEILTAMGIRCIDATGAVEAEALASSIVLAGHADYVASEDTDVLVYGAPLIRNITGHNEPLLVISGAEVRAQLDLDVPSYVDFALLLGTDFSQRIKNIGPMRAYDLIKKHGSIERVLDSIASEPKYELKLPRHAYLAQVEIARLVFGTLPPVPPLEAIQSIKRNDERVTEVMGRYQLGRFLHEEDLQQWYYDATCASAMAGNFFHDDPHAA